jgi:hypothetical protein
MRKTLAALVPALFVALVCVVLTPATAQAQVLTIKDPYDKGWLVEDIRAVKITHGPTNVFVRTAFYPRANPEVVVAWIDTRKGDSGPEFALRRHAGWPKLIGVTRVDDWRWGGEKERRCAGASVRIDDGDILMKVPRHCIRIDGAAPRRVRVAVHAYDEQFVDRTEDWAPRERRFGARFVYST